MSEQAIYSDAVVSFDDEPLILVDEHDNVLGHDSKAACHDGDGLLHRAFSIFVFNRDGDLLLQQRSPQKRLWPGYWSNSCCSHPRQGEEDAAAADRRILEELGLRPALYFLYKFRYQVRYDANGGEHELCSVYAAVSDAAPQVNDNEIAATRHIAPATLEAELVANPHAYTPWLKLEWPEIREQHWASVERLLRR